MYVYIKVKEMEVTRVEEPLGGEICKALKPFALFFNLLLAA